MAEATPPHEPRARGGDPGGEEDAELHATIDCERMSIARAHMPWIQIQSSSDEARL